MFPKTNPRTSHAPLRVGDRDRVQASVHAVSVAHGLRKVTTKQPKTIEIRRHSLESRVDKRQDKPVAIFTEGVNQTNLNPRTLAGLIENTDLKTMQFISPVDSTKLESVQLVGSIPTTNLDSATLNGVIECDRCLDSVQVACPICKTCALNAGPS